MRRAWIVLALSLCALPVQARQKTQGWCENGNQPVITGGVNSTTRVQRSYSACTVTVYVAGTGTLALIYDDDAGTSKANPFTAAAEGSWYFYADTGRYDVRFSGTGITTPFTRGDYPTGALANVYTANLLPLPGVAGAIARLTDSSRGLWLDTGTQWISTTGGVDNVRDFGAHGNGIANDTTALQDAVNALPATGGVVYVPCGTYLTTAAIALKANVWMQGSGPCSVLLVEGDTHGITVYGTGGTMMVGVAVTDLSIQKGAGSVASDVAISSTYTVGLRIEHVVVTNNGGVWGSAFAITDGNYGRIIDSEAYGVTTNVISLNTSTATVSTTVGLKNAVIRGVYNDNGQGVDVLGQTDFLIDGMQSTGNVSTFAYGIVVEGATYRGTIQNCYLAGHNFGGIDFEPIGGYYEITVQGCTLHNNPTGGNPQSGGVFWVNNIVDDSTVCGIVNSGGQGAMFIGNIFRNNRVGLAINVTAGATRNNSVIGNYFTNNYLSALVFTGAEASNMVIGNYFNYNGPLGLGPNISGMDTGMSLIDAGVNLRGSATISGGATSANVTVDFPDNSYRVVCSKASASGAPALGSNRCDISGKTAAGFTINVEVAPGGGNSVDIDYVIIR